MPVSEIPGRRWNPRSLGGARARSVSASESRRSPGARRGLQRATGSGRAPPRSLPLAHQMRVVCGIVSSWGCRGVLSHNQTITGGKGDRDPARVSQLWEEPPRCFPAWATSECPLGAGPELGVRAPAPGSRGPRSSAPARVPAPIPPRPLPGRSPAQPSPARIRFRTLAAVAKDRRTPHHPLKIRPLALHTGSQQHRVGTRGGRKALRGPAGARVAQAQDGRRTGGSGSGCTAPHRQRGLGCGRWDRGAGGKHRGARGSGERTCAEVRWEPG